MKGAQGRLLTKTTMVAYEEWQGREMTAVYFHDTPVVTWDENTIVLRTNGWKTYWTKQKMNQTSRDFRLGFRVYSEGGCWWVWQDDWQRARQWGTTPNQIILKRRVQ